jgi:hypothetical protein
MPETAPGRASPAIVGQAFGLNGASIGGVAIGLLTGAGAIVPCAARAVPARPALSRRGPRCPGAGCRGRGQPCHADRGRRGTGGD